MLNKKYADIRILVLALFAIVLVCTGAWGQTFEVLHSLGNTGVAYEITP